MDDKSIQNIFYNIQLYLTFDINNDNIHHNNLNGNLQSYINFAFDPSNNLQLLEDSLVKSKLNLIKIETIADTVQSILSNSIIEDHILLYCVQLGLAKLLAYKVWLNIDFDLFCLENNYNDVLNIEGETLSDAVSCSALLYYCQIITREMCNYIQNTMTDDLSNMQYINTSFIWKARVSLMHYLLLSNTIVPSLLKHNYTAITNYLVFCYLVNVCDEKLFTAIETTIENLAKNNLSTNNTTIRKSELVLHTSNTNEFLQHIKSNNKGKLNCFINEVDDIKLYLLFELANLCVNFGFPSLVHKSLTSLFGYSFKFSGKLGYKRKHQQSPIAQLIIVKDVQLETKNQNSNNNEDKIEHICADGIKNTNLMDQLETVKKLQLVDIYDKIDIFELPKYVDGEEILSLNMFEQLYLLLWSTLLLINSSKNDEINMNRINTIVNTCIYSSKKKMNINMHHSPAILDSYALYLRSIVEYHKPACKERSNLQLLEVQNSMNQGRNNIEAKRLFVWFLNHPSYIELTRKIAYNYLNSGGLTTAKTMFIKLKMYIEGIECLINSNKKAEAEEILVKILETNKSPIYVCLLGIVRGNLKIIEDAWDMSNKSLLKAAYYLSLYHFSTIKFRNCDNNDENSVYIANAKKWLESYIAIQPNNSLIQFKYGSLCMLKNELENAILAFRAVTRIDPENSEAWGNLAGIYARLNNWEFAYNIAINSIKNAETNWKLYELLYNISLRAKKHLVALNCMFKLVELGHTQSITLHSMHSLVLFAISNEIDDMHTNINNSLNKFFELYHQHHPFVVPSLYKSNFTNKLNTNNINFPSDSYMHYIDSYKIWSILSDYNKNTAKSIELNYIIINRLLTIINDVCLNDISIFYPYDFDYYSYLKKLITEYLTAYNTFIDFIYNNIKCSAPEAIIDKNEAENKLYTHCKYISNDLKNCKFLTSDIKNKLIIYYETYSNKLSEKMKKVFI